MPTTLIGIQEWYMGCLRRNGYKGWKFFRSKALKSLESLGFTTEQSMWALRDAADMLNLERICECQN